MSSLHRKPQYGNLGKAQNQTQGLLFWVTYGEACLRGAVTSQQSWISLLGYSNKGRHR